MTLNSMNRYFVSLDWRCYIFNLTASYWLKIDLHCLLYVCSPKCSFWQHMIYGDIPKDYREQLP